MNDPMVDRLDEQELPQEPLEVPQPRAVGSPLPRGNGLRVHLPPNYDDLELKPPVAQPIPQVAGQAGPVLAPPISAGNSAAQVSPNERVLDPRPAAPIPLLTEAASASPARGIPPQGPPTSQRRLPPPPAPPATGFQRAVGAIRSALPFVQKLLPLLEGNVASAVSNILAPQPPARPAAPAPPPVDLTPLQQSITDLQTKHRDLRDQVTEQNTSLKRVEDRLEMVREATDRNTLEQQELLADLKSMGRKVNVVAAVAIGLLAVSLLLNLALFLHIQRVLP